MSSAICVFSKPNCQQCMATKVWLRNRGAAFTEVDVMEDADALEYITDLGYRHAPVVVTSAGEHWSGFQLDRLKAAVR